MFALLLISDYDIMHVKTMLNDHGGLQRHDIVYLIGYNLSRKPHESIFGKESGNGHNLF